MPDYNYGPDLWLSTFKIILKNQFNFFPKFKMVLKEVFFTTRLTHQIVKTTYNTLTFEPCIPKL